MITSWFNFKSEVRPMSAGRVRGRAAQPQSGAVPAARLRRVSYIGRYDYQT